MDLEKLPSGTTQIIYFTIAKDKDLTTQSDDSGKSWAAALDSVKSSPGYQGLCWGRSVEQPDKVQLHVVRTSLQAHRDWLISSKHGKFLQTLEPLIESSHELVIRHVTPMSLYTTSPTTAFHAPVTGTAIYLRATPAWHEGSWPCWTHIVRHVAGNSGIAGGKLVEPFNAETSKQLAGISAPETKPESSSNPDTDCFLVYVGWETVKAHNDYHHTQHFRDHGLILRIGNSGWREYGHIKFEGWHGEMFGFSEMSKGAKL